MSSVWRGFVGFAVLAFATFGHAALVSYDLDQSNTLPDGTAYLRLTIDDQGLPGRINYRASILDSLPHPAFRKFGIDEFEFNSAFALSSSNITAEKIGSMLLVEQRMVGRAEITEKPDVLWDNPFLEGLFVRLEGEFEIGEPHTAIERKLNLISSTVHTVLELVSSRHALRVEWYIVILIVFEIFLTLYQLFLR